VKPTDDEVSERVEDFNDLNDYVLDQYNDVLRKIKSAQRLLAERLEAERKFKIYRDQILQAAAGMQRIEEQMQDVMQELGISFWDLTHSDPDDFDDDNQT
jgi:hypothetical protein